MLSAGIGALGAALSLLLPCTTGHEPLRVFAAEQNESAPAGAPLIPPVAQLPEASPKATQARVRPVLTMISPGVFEMGGVRIVKSERQVEFSAVVNMNRGLLEYLIVGASGKVHESLLRTDTEPYCLHIALLLLGLEGTTQPPAAQGDQGAPRGDPVDILVEWQEDGQKRRARIEEWVLNKKDGAPLKPMQWVFTGSFIAGGVFMAQAEKSIAALHHDPIALIDNPLLDGGSDEIWFANEGAAPAVGAEVRVFIQRAASR